MATEASGEVIIRTGIDISGARRDSAGIERIIREIGRENESTEEGAVESIENVSNRSTNALKKFSSRFNTFSNGLRSKLGGIASVMTGAFGGIGGIFSKGKGMGGSLDIALLNKYVLGIKSLYALMTKVKGTLTEGLQSLALYNDETNRSVSGLASSLSYLKSSFANAFAPIFNIVAPALTQFINLLAKASNWVGMFFASLTGKGSYVRAIPVYKDYAESLNDIADGADNAAEATKDATKAANKYLSPLDTINKWTESSQGGGSGSGGGAGSGAGAGQDAIFETVNVDYLANNWADRIKEMWAKADFSELGAYIGTSIRNGLERIDWASIQATAARIGTSFATLINGFVDVPRLASSIGHSIAEAWNTGLNLAHGFVSELHFDSIGQFAADALNEGFSTFNWDMLSETITTAINGAFTTVKKFAETFNWKKTAAAIVRSINKTIRHTDWALVGNAVGDMLTGALDFLGTALDEFDWVGFGESIAEFLVNLDWDGIVTEVGTIIEGVAKGILGTIEGLVLGFFDNIFGTGYERKIRSIKKDIADLDKSFSEVGKEAATNKSYIDDVFEKWDELNQRFLTNGSLTEGEQTLFKFYRDELVKYCPEMEQYIGDVSKAYDGTKEALQRLIDEQYRQIQLNAYTDLLEGYYKTLYENQALFDDIHDDMITRLQTLAEQYGTTFTTDDMAAFVAYIESGLDPALTTGTEGFQNLINLLMTDDTLVDYTSQLSDLGTEMNTTNGKIDDVKSHMQGLGTEMEGTSEKIQTESEKSAKKVEHTTDMLKRSADQLKTDIREKFKAVGSNISEGIGAGLDGRWSWLSSKVSGVASNLLQRAKDALGIHSPSRVFRDEVGGNIQAGIAEGLERYSGDTYRTMEKVSEKLPYYYNLPEVTGIARGAVAPAYSTARTRLTPEDMQTLAGMIVGGMTATQLSGQTAVAGGGTYQVNAKVNQRTLFEVIIDEAKTRQRASGRNPFEI